MDHQEESDIILFASKKTKANEFDRQDNKIIIKKKERPLVVKENVAEPTSFADLGVDPWIIESLKTLFITKPTPVQSACIKMSMEGKPILAASRTGTGKTVAFAVPILQSLGRDPRGNFALILTPTRELAIQILEQFQAIGKPLRIRTAFAVGGLDMMTQVTEIVRKPHILVATPGRLLDICMSNPEINLADFHTVVFDEADRLLDPNSSFMKLELPLLTEKLSPSCQKMYFSATITNKLREIATSASPGIFDFNGNTEFGIAKNIMQSYILVPSQVREAFLVALLRDQLKDAGLILFVGKCITCALLSKTLSLLKIPNVSLHGKLSQKLRLKALDKFRSGLTKVLITTDVGSRGLDIPSVDVVVNYDLPVDARDYVHRIGRTARAGRSGQAISLVYELDVDLLGAIENTIGKKLKFYETTPSDEEVNQLLNEVTIAKREASMCIHDSKMFEKSLLNKRKWSKST